MQERNQTPNRILEQSNIIERYQLPDDEGWQDIDDVPADLRRTVELHIMSRTPGESNEDVRLPNITLDEFYDVYDDWVRNDQQVRLVRDSEGGVVGMISYYLQRNGTPFMESVAVDPEERGGGIGGQLIASSAAELRGVGAETASTMAQPRVVEMYKKMGAQVVGRVGDLVKMSIPLVDGMSSQETAQKT